MVKSLFQFLIMIKFQMNNGQLNKNWGQAQMGNMYKMNGVFQIIVTWYSAHSELLMYVRLIIIYLTKSITVLKSLIHFFPTLICP